MKGFRDAREIKIYYILFILNLSQVQKICSKWLILNFMKFYINLTTWVKLGFIKVLGFRNVNLTIKFKTNLYIMSVIFLSVFWLKDTDLTFSKFFKNIYKYLRPHKPSSLLFILFPKVSNWHFILCENTTDKKNALYLIFSKTIFLYFYPNEVDERNLLLSLAFTKITRWFFNSKKVMGKKINW